MTSGLPTFCWTSKKPPSTWTARHEPFTAKVIRGTKPRRVYLPAFRLSRAARSSVASGAGVRVGTAVGVGAAVGVGDGGGSDAAAGVQASATTCSAMRMTSPRALARFIEGGTYHQARPVQAAR